MTAKETITLELEISAADATEAEIDSMTRSLLAELHETNAESIELGTSGPVPPGTKSAGLIPVSTIILTVVPTLISEVIEIAIEWKSRRKGRTVKFRGRVGDQVVDFEGNFEELEKILQTLSSDPKKP